MTKRAVNFFVKANQKQSAEKRVSMFKTWFNRIGLGKEMKAKRYRTKALTPRLSREAAKMREHYRAQSEKNRLYS